MTIHDDDDPFSDAIAFPRRLRSRSLLYMLAPDGKTPIPIEDENQDLWSRWFESGDRVVAQTEVPGGMISTVFLGLDHNFSPGGPPVLWETMAFMDGNDSYQDRYTSYADALAGHKAIVEKALKGKRLDDRL